MAWAEFVAAFGFFFVSHSVPVRGPIRERIIEGIGGRGFILAYSLLSLAALGWLIVAAGRAPFVQLWPWAPWQPYVPLIVMPPVCLIVALALARPDPFSFGGANNDAFDPSRPGIVGWTRHPLLVALGLWAGAHIAPNGDLAHVLLFGAFAVFAVAGQRLVDRRKRRELGARWEELDHARRRGRSLDVRRFGPRFAARILFAVVLYLGLIAIHPVLFGVSPLP
ncbi:MAG: NnrU family protein [Phyllobacteriaceae bacterium]|nr:NnrU family protein [Phyllobacteriaceae bacterium]